MDNAAIQLITTLFSMIGAVVGLIIGVSKHKKLSVQIGASFLMITGFIVILGYIAHAPTVYTFPPTEAAMSLPSGICFVITGATLLVLINNIDFKK